MKALLFLLLVPVIAAAQAPQAPPGGRGRGQGQGDGPLTALFPEQTGPPANYRGYARNNCVTTDGASVRLTVLQGVVPDGVPQAPPRPSIELLVYAPIEKVVGQQLNLAAKPAEGGAVAISCPVVGACAAAEGGTLTISARGDNGALTGEFRAKWAIGAPRAGRFTADWREADNKCG